MASCNLSHPSTTGTEEIMMNTSLGKSSWLIGPRKSSPKINKTVSHMILNDAKQIVAELNSKSANEPISPEKMSGSQIPEEKPHSSVVIVVDQTRLSKDTELEMNDISNDVGKEDTITESDYTSTDVDDVTPKSVCEKEEIFSEIQKEKLILEELKVSLDKCLPISPDLVNIQDSSEEDDYFLEDDSRDDNSYFTPLGSLPAHLQPQAYRNALEIIRGAKYDIRELLYQLYETIELTYQSKQGSENRQSSQKALFELWIKWNRSQSVNADSQLLETRTLAMSRSITLKLQSAFMDLMPKIQGLPSSLQDRLQQACCDMRELHTTFSLSNGFEDLDRYQLTHSQFMLTQAQGSIEQLLCFLEHNVPSEWVVGPLCPSDFPEKDVITIPKKTLEL
ncbi:perilipin-3-like [Gracilinanus agilis]|uniref:perilipin-3-like n=1 Tax=Gracilinanus agilis TaxID=191870 RepID=UPI001CFD06E8|nr:perilipin-3-like [Gracilinanus agilis]